MSLFRAYSDRKPWLCAIPAFLFLATPLAHGGPIATDSGTGADKSIIDGRKTTARLPTDINSWLNGTTTMRSVPGLETPWRPLANEDRTAVLEAIDYALNEVGDGATFVWYRKRGSLNGTVQPTTAFRDNGGRVCRHLVFKMSLKGKKHKIEGIACRNNQGRWQLSG